jgi:hypothetical protein
LNPLPGTVQDDGGMDLGIASDAVPDEDVVAEQCDQPALRERVARVELQDLEVAAHRLVGPALGRGDRGQAEERV